MSDKPSTTTEVNKISPELLLNEIDSRIVRIKPSATPVDQISRLAGARNAGSMIVDYYSVDIKEIKDEVVAFEESADYSDFNGGKVYRIRFKTNRVFNETDTVLVPNNTIAPDGTSRNAYPLVGFLSKRLDNPGEFIIIFTNTLPDGYEIDPYNIIGENVVRMGRAAAELDVQTPIFESIPRKSRNFCQIFKSQIEQSTLVKIANKEVGWDFSDQEEIAISDMRRGMEKSFLFGQQARITDPVRNEEIFFTGGIWTQAGKEIVLGDTFNTSDLVNLAREVFVGNSGSNRKLLIGGSKFIARLHNIDDVQRVIGARDYVTKWGIDFSELHTKFGTFYVLLSETFDECGHADDAMVIDPEYMTKYSHIPFQTERLDLRSAGVRNTDAVVVTEASCLVLRMPSAHFRIIGK